MSCETQDKLPDSLAQDFSPEMTLKDKALAVFRFWFDNHQERLRILANTGNSSSINAEYATVVLAIVQDQEITNRELRREAFRVLNMREERGVVQKLADQDLVLATVNYLESLRSKLSA